MKNAFSAVGLIGRHEDLRVRDTFVALAQHLETQNVAILVTRDCSLDFGATKVQKVDEAKLPELAELIVTVGGDGTMLYASRLVAGHDIPLLGINRGRLGFLADITPAQMNTHIDAVLSGHYIKDQRMVLSATLLQDNKPVREGIALNDVVLQRWEMGVMLEVATVVDGVYVNTHRGDGLIVTTPTGSTAYSLSCDGPIMHPALNAIAIVPICPHTLSDRPIVLDGNSHIDISLVQRDNTSAQAVCDGKPIGLMTGNETLRVSQANFQVTLIHPASHDYYKILRSKLNWGRSSAIENGER